MLPAPGTPPVQPERLDVRPGPGRLALSWPTATGAVGYEVRWGDRTRLVAQPAVQLDGLTDEQQYRVEVRSVGPHGERSLAAITHAAPHPAEARDWAFADEFDAGPGKWRFTSAAGCGAAGLGKGDDARRLVVTAQCGSEPVALAARTPLRLGGGPELGRFVVDTDQPGRNGDLLLDLVPGPVAQVGAGAGTAKPGQPGQALDDPTLPPGAIRVRVGAQPGAPTSVQVLVAPGTPRKGKPVRVAPVPSADIGVTVRWEVVLTTDGVRVLREGTVVGAGDVVPAWREATAVIGLSGGRGGVRAALDFAGFTGAPTATPALSPAPPLDTGQVVTDSRAFQTPSGGAWVSGVTGGRLLLTLVPQNGPEDPARDVYTVEVGGKQYPAKPAVPGQPMTRGVRYPVYADLPADALVLRADGRTLPLRVHGPPHPGRAATRVLAAHLELTPRPDTTPPPPAPVETLERTRPALARPAAVLLDAAGRALAEGGARRAGGWCWS
ncbi:hypothetical protein ACFQV2_40020 [Actinokineospora soli]|uniref:Fibronectin type-III domain-containing protein n=1 Tax=Actinokineospora soli TaxID=1048753 RepID=A0ABW2TZE1_9PSEU